MSLAIQVLYLWFTSNCMAAMLDFAKMAAPWGARHKKTPKSMTWATSEPNLVLLEESGPKYPKHLWLLWAIPSLADYIISG